MKKLIPFLFGTFWLLAAVSCYREEPAIGHLTVQLEFEHATDAVDITRIEVSLNNKNADFHYTAFPDASGKATFDVQPGKYDVIASAWFPATRIAVNGASEEFLLLDEHTVRVPLHVAIPNPLIIREAYWIYCLASPASSAPLARTQEQVRPGGHLPLQFDHRQQRLGRQ